MPPQQKKAPQDHKPKTAKPGEFTADGKSYTLPPPSQALGALKGRALRDALLGGQEGELRLAFLALEACGTDQATLDALYDLPIADMMGVVGPWLQAADLDGAALPE